MIKNIFNWTLGGFFRTLGRVLCFLILGTIIGYLISLSGFNFPSWLKIGYIVKAEVLEQWSTSESRYRFDERGTQTWSSFENTPHTWSPTFPVSALQFRVYATNGLDSQNTYVLKFGYLPNPQSLSPSSIEIRKGGQTSSIEEINCSQWVYNNNGYNLVSCSFTPRDNYTSSESLIITVYFYQGYLTSIRSYMYGFEERVGTNAVITQTGDQIIENQNENTQDIIDNQNENTQEQIESQKVCIIIDQNLIKIDNKYIDGSQGQLNNSDSFGITDYIPINNTTTINVLLNMNSTSKYCFYNNNKEVINCYNLNTLTSDSTLTIPNNTKYFRSSIFKPTNRPTYKICSNGNQAVSDSLNNFFNDSDTSSDSSNASNFFHNFNLSLEGPISQIVLLPINMLQYLVVDYNSNTSHSNLCTTFNSQQICLPSGDILWKRSPGSNLPFGLPNYANFRAFFQLVVGGFIYYKLCRRLVSSAEKGLDPQESGVSMIKL